MPWRDPVNRAPAKSSQQPYIGDARARRVSAILDVKGARETLVVEEGTGRIPLVDGESSVQLSAIPLKVDSLVRSTSC